MTYIDLRPYKPRGKKREESVAETTSSVSAATISAPSATLEQADFLANLAGAGKEEIGTAAQRADVIEILNLLHEKLTTIEERLFRIERKMEEE